MITITTDNGHYFEGEIKDGNLIAGQMIDGLEVWLWIEDESLYLSVDNRQVSEIELFDGDTYYVNISNWITKIKDYNK